MKRKIKKSKARGKKVFPQVTGKVQMTREGFICVIPEVEGDAEREDVFVKASKTRHALNGDVVRVSVTKQGDKAKGKRCEGEVVEILQRSNKPFVGIYHSVGSQAWVLMQSKLMPYDIEVDPEEAEKLGARAGMKVAALVDRWDRKDICPRGHISDVLGEPGANDTEMHAILAEFNLPYRFSKEVEDAADKISDTIGSEEMKGRKDFRKRFTFTIDPADAKDFDDALSIERLSNGNYRNTGREGWKRRGSRETTYPEQETRVFRPAEKKEQYLLVDGYNVIFAWEELKELAQINLDGARGKLLDILCNYQAVKKCNLIAVFDAYRLEGHQTEVLDYHNVHVVYTKEAETADRYIERFAHENAKKYDVTVVTSDGLEQIIIVGEGCHLVSSREFEKEVALAARRVLEEFQSGNHEGSRSLQYVLSEEKAGDSATSAPRTDRLP